ncbi:CBS domain-containing protein [Flavobacterium sp.]|uniref:CBS domain-containing protein n=1 Tax=Flavobacterium sp. TaxID=239 RepID=UPI0035297A6C
MNSIFSYINRDLRPLKTTDTISYVQDFFLNLNYSHFPVLENGVFIGSISRDNADILEGETTITDNKYELDRFYVRVNMIWLDVLEVFAQNETNIVPVLSDKNKYVGYYELEDVIRFFHETPFLKEDGGILVVEKDVTNYTMGQIVQIVESNNARLLGAFVSKIENNKVEITLKTSGGSLNDIIQTFRRFEYQIVSEIADDNYLQNLKERSDYLDKYLSL